MTRQEKRLVEKFPESKIAPARMNSVGGGSYRSCQATPAIVPFVIAAGAGGFTFDTARLREATEKPRRFAGERPAGLFSTRLGAGLFIGELRRIAADGTTACAMRTCRIRRNFAASPNFGAAPRFPRQHEDIGAPPASARYRAAIW